MNNILLIICRIGLGYSISKLINELIELRKDLRLNYCSTDNLKEAIEWSSFFVFIFMALIFCMVIGVA